MCSSECQWGEVPFLILAYAIFRVGVQQPEKVVWFCHAVSHGHLVAY